MDFKKTFDYSDINNFLPDNTTVGTSDFYRNKFQNKFPDHYYDIFEVMSRSEYSENETIQLIENVRNEMRAENKKIIDEWNQRLLDSQIEVGQVVENLEVVVENINQDIDILIKVVDDIKIVVENKLNVD